VVPQLFVAIPEAKHQRMMDGKLANSLGKNAVATSTSHVAPRILFLGYRIFIPRISEWISSDNILFYFYSRKDLRKYSFRLSERLLGEIENVVWIPSLRARRLE